MAQSRSTLIVCEKPSARQIILPRWQEAHPCDRISVFYCPPIGSFRFRLPRNLPLSAVPIVKDMELEPRPWPHRDDGQHSIFDGDFGTLAAAADHIVCATDRDPQGCRNFLDLMQHHRVAMPLSTVSWLPLAKMSEAHIDHVIAKDLRADHPDMERMAGFGLAKQHFDHLYLLNALPVFGRALRMSGIDPDGEMSFLSKYALQTLLLLDRLGADAQSEGQIILMMQGNPASRKRSPIGTPISRDRIVDWLQRSGCLEPAGRNHKGRVLWNISDRGRRLIHLMHKDCFDPDFAARIELWGQDWPASRPKIERYIRTFFGKQKRFLLTHP